MTMMARITKNVMGPAAMTAGCLLTAMLTVMYVNWIGDSAVRLATLPVLGALLLFLAIDRRRLFLLIMLLRAAGDLVLDSTKVGTSSVSIGLGGALNALVILIAGLFILDRPRDTPKLHFPAWSWLMLLVLVCGVIQSPEPGNAVRTFLVLLSYAAVFVIPFYLPASTDNLGSCLRIVLLSSLLPVAYSAIEVATGGSNFGPEGFRLKSTFAHPNIFAFYLLLVISLIAYQLKQGLGRAAAWRPALLGYMGILLVLLVMTKTRSAWLACALMFVVYGVALDRRLLLGLLALPLVFLVPEVRDRLTDLGAGKDYLQYAKLNSFDWRVLIWKSGIGWMQPEKWFAGYGLNSFKYYSPVFFPLAGNMNSGAHNIYVQLLFETGITGIACFAWMMIRLFRRLAMRMREDRAGRIILLALLLEYLVVCASDNMIDYLSFNWYFWFVIGAACAETLRGGKPAPPPRIDNAVGRDAIAPRKAAHET